LKEDQFVGMWQQPTAAFYVSSSLTLHSLLLHCGHGKKCTIIFSVIALICVWELELQLFAAAQCTSTHSVSTTDSHINRGLWPPDLMFICGIFETGKSVEIIHMG